MKIIPSYQHAAIFVPCVYKRHVALPREGGWVHTKCPSRVDMLKTDTLQAAAIICLGYAPGGDCPRAPLTAPLTALVLTGQQYSNFPIYLIYTK